jgi:hypothetical protein
VPTSGQEGTISMTSAAAQDTADQDVFGGVDSHADTIHVAVIGDNGGHLADAEFATTAAGYAAALAFLNAHGQVTAIGVEGTYPYGDGFTRAARSAGLDVVEVNRPDRAERRRIGKPDPIDAYAAARAALSGRASSAPNDDTVAGIRALHNAARSAVKARTAALNQFTELRNRGLEDVLMLVCDGLKGLCPTRWRPSGLERLSRPASSISCAARSVTRPARRGGRLAKALRPVCTAPTAEAA